jgi:hypothetical protein
VNSLPEQASSHCNWPARRRQEHAATVARGEPGRGRAGLWACKGSADTMQSFTSLWMRMQAMTWLRAIRPSVRRTAM